MSEHSSIETDATWKPVRGCTKVNAPWPQERSDDHDTHTHVLNRGGRVVQKALRDEREGQYEATHSQTYFRFWSLTAAALL